ncbi:DotA/TraY family protein [Sulfuricella sp.]|uniref:DotA/TraY family protein n=1 Tax=Sulfuricella sp. TaxID=2099377 RepID=UPI002C108FE9|nr:DotA/TraY family protein [Sulfuricella sp.]HUX62233.1 DotA/TraY family protein [Sulfuricella sp.]
MDKKKAVFTGISVVSGWWMAKQAAGAVGEVVTAAGRVGKLAKTALFDRRKPIKETFADAVARLDLTEADLHTRAREFQYRSALWFLVFVVGFSVFAISPMVSNMASHAMLSAGVMLLGVVNTLHWHFRACQVRDRALYGFGGWFVRDIWVRRVAMAIGIIASLALALFASSARADSGSLHLFTPPPGDASVKFLREIFGPIVDKISAGANAESGQVDSPLGAMLAPFNSAVMFLGMLFVAYTTVKGTIDSAHDGQLLGKKMSEIWVPIRTVGGSALLLPLGSGYSLIQIVVLWLAVQSAGIGDAVLNAGLDYIAETNMVSRPHLPDTRQFASSILRSEVCMAAMNKQYTDSNQSRRILPEEKSWIVANTGEIGLVDVALGPIGVGKALYDSSYRVTEFHWREMENGKPARLSPDVCGALTWEQSDEASEGNSNTRIAKQPIMLAQANAVRQMIADLRPVAQQIVAFQPPAPGAIEIAAANYENALMQAAKSAVQQTSDTRRTQFIDAVRAGGWIYLPTYYNQLIQLNDVMQASLNALPSTSPISISDKETKETLQTYDDAMSVANEYLKARSDAPRQELRRQFKEDGEFPTSWGDIKRLLSGFAQKGIYSFTQELAGSNLSHVGQIKAVGDSIIGTAEAIATFLAVTSGGVESRAVSWTVGNFFNAGAALNSVSWILQSIVLGLLIFGSIAAYYIPLIPFIVGVTAVIKWFVLVFEMVIASPIMAAAHMHPDGDDQVGRAGPGYMLILGLVMRPTLTVLGFFGSIWLAQPVTGYINLAYMTTVQGAEHNSFSFIAAFVAYVVIYVIIMTGVIHSVFALVNWLPDNALRTIGGSMGVHGIADDSEQKEAAHRYQAVMMNMSKGGGGSPKKPGGGGNGGGKGEGDGGTLSQADKDRGNAELLPDPR